MTQPMPKPLRKPAPSVRGSLSRERIAEAALAMIDRYGVDGLALRKLAQALGCEAMSLYHHVQDKDDLLDAVMDRLLSEWELAPLDSAEPRRLMRQAADSYRAIAQRHPRAFALLTSRRFNTPYALQVLEHMLGILARAGLPAAECARGFRIIGGFLNGLLLAEAAVQGVGRAASGPVLVDRAPQDFPMTRAAAPWLGPQGIEASYQTGIEWLLDAVIGPPPVPAGKKRTVAARR